MEEKEYEMPAKIGIHPLEEAFFHAMPAYGTVKKRRRDQAGRMFSKKS